MVRSTAHGPARSAIASVSSSTVSSVSASASPMAAMTSSACPGVKRTPSGWVGTGDGRTGSARSTSAGRRWQQADGAARTERLDQGALAPQRALHVGAGRPGDPPPDGQFGRAEDLGVGPAQQAGTAAGPRSAAGSVSACRAIRRAATRLQVRAAGAVDFAVMNADFSLACPIPVTPERAAGANALVIPSPGSARRVMARDRPRGARAPERRPSPAHGGLNRMLPIGHMIRAGRRPRAAAA